MQSREMSSRSKSKSEKTGRKNGTKIQGGGGSLKAGSPRENGMTKRSDNNVAHSRNEILALVPTRCDRALPLLLCCSLLAS